MELSIIIPCYCVAEYLPACLESVCRLPQETVEILCVDDASPDGCAGILADYAARYPHIHVHTHPKNRGLSAARNTGLAYATGDYVLFVDSDDILRTEMVLPLLARAQSGGLDILQAAYSRFEDGTNRELPVPPRPKPTAVLLGDVCFAQLCAQRTYEPMTVLRFYRNAFLEENGLRMAEGFLFEDELFTAPAMLRARRIQVLDTVFYRYRQRAGGIMAGFQKSANWCLHYLQIAQLLHGRYERMRPTPGRNALRRRAAEIALSIPKNIAAYRLKGDVRKQAIRFLRVNRAEIVHIAWAGESTGLRVQAALLSLSLPLYLGLYYLLSGRQWIRKQGRKASPQEEVVLLGK